MNEIQDGTYLKSADGRLVRVEVAKGYWVATEPVTLADTRIGDLVGVWVDSETGVIHLDRVRLMLTLDNALALGRRHRQIAIWDNANAEEVRL